MRRVGPFSIALELTLLISALLVLVIGAFTWVAYTEVRRSARAAATEHLERVTSQLHDDLRSGTPQRFAQAQRLAALPEVRRYVRHPTVGTRAAARAALTRLSSLDSLNAAVDLWDRTGLRVLAVGRPMPPLALPAARALGDSAAGPAGAAIGPLRILGDSLFFPVIAPVMAGDPAAGYVVNWRRVLTSPQTLTNLSELIGSGAALLVGNAQGDLWTDLIRRVEAPPAPIPERGGVMEYHRPGRGWFLARGVPIRGTPWLLVIEFPRDRVFGRAHAFLRRLVVIALVLVAVAAAGAWILSRQITTPLRGQERRRTESRLAAIVRAALDAHITMNAEGTIETWNPQAEAIFGWPEQEVIGRHVADIVVPPAQRDAHWAGLRRFLKTGEGSVINRRIELLALRRDGTEFPAELTIAPIRLGESWIFSAFVRDITARKGAEDALRRSEERYRLLFETTPAPMWVYDLASLRFLAVNDAAARQYGYSRAEFVGMNIEQLRPPEEVPRLRALIAAGTPPGSTRGESWRHVTKDGKIITVEVSSHEILFEGRRAQLVVSNDVTARVRAHVVQTAVYHIAEATQTAAGLPELLRAIHDIVGTLMPAKSFYIALYDEATDLITFPYYVDEVDPLPPAPRHPGRGITEYVLQTGRSLLAKPESKLEMDYGGSVEAVGAPSVDWLGVPLMQGTRTIGVLAVQSYTAGVRYEERDKDILQFVSTQVATAIARKRAEEALRNSEEQLRQAQKMEAVGRLAGGIAHDFNNLLTAIFGYSDLLAEELPPGSPAHDDLKEIRTAATRAAALTRQLLAFSRQQLLQPVVLNINDVIENLEDMLRRLLGEDIELETHLTGDLGNARADAGQLEQVIMNLAVNARDAMPTGGKLTIETANVALGAEYAAAHRPVVPGNYVMLAVSDSGVGMDERVKTKLFEPFFTTKEPGKGTGLGLATVYGIVKQSGGYIWVYSEPGHGATFKVYLPLEQAPVEEVKKAMPAAGKLGGTETILLAEDDGPLRALAQELLVKLGYRVLGAADAGAALKLARAHPDDIDLLLSDVVMRGQSGLQLAQQLAAERPQMKVLYMSGYTDEAIVRHGLLEPGTNFLQKPFTPTVLARKVREVLDAPLIGTR